MLAQQRGDVRLLPLLQTGEPGLNLLGLGLMQLGDLDVASC